MCRNPNPEVRGYAFVAFGRTAQFIVQIFFMTGAIYLAYKQAGCRHMTDDEVSAFESTNDYEDDELNGFYVDYSFFNVSDGLPHLCDTHKDIPDDPRPDSGRAYNMQPNSIATLIPTIGNLVAAVTIPFMGSIVDATSLRRQFGILCGGLLSLITLIQIFLNEDTWFVMIMLQAFCGSTATFGLVLMVFSYLPELGDNEPENTRIITIGKVFENIGMMWVLVAVTVLGGALSLDVVGTAVLGQILATVIGVPLTMYPLVTLYQDRAANRVIPENKSLIADSCSNLCGQFSDLYNKYPQVGRFLIATLFYEASASNVTFVATLWLTHIGFPLDMVGTYVSVFVVSMIPGPFMQLVTAPRIGLKNSLILCLSANVVTVILFFVLGRITFIAWCFAPIFGFMFGWFHAASNALYSAIIPGGREASLMGLNLFCGVVLAWLPSLVITVGNETGYLLLTVMICPLFWFIGIVVLSTMDMEKAYDDIALDADKRQKAHFSTKENNPMGVRVEPSPQML